MKNKIEKIWSLSLPYLKKGKRKDFVLHTKGVVKAMESLLKKEKGVPNILITAAIMHDTGWSNVPLSLQKTKNKNKVKKAMELHLKYSSPIINEVLSKLGYNNQQIKEIINIVLSHKFKRPRNLNKRLMIDADTLSDVFKEQFYEDCREYKLKPEILYNIRKNNKFYTKTARIIFNKELGKRRKEIFT